MRNACLFVVFLAFSVQFSQVAYANQREHKHGFGVSTNETLAFFESTVDLRRCFANADICEVRFVPMPFELNLKGSALTHTPSLSGRLSVAFTVSENAPPMLDVQIFIIKSEDVAPGLIFVNDIGADGIPDRFIGTVFKGDTISSMCWARDGNRFCGPPATSDDLEFFHALYASLLPNLKEQITRRRKAAGAVFTPL